MRAYFYDNPASITALELRELYSYTSWGKSREVSGIEQMLRNTDLCFSARLDDKLVGFCRMLTDFTYRGVLLDIAVHPDYQGRGLGSALIDYALTHPRTKDLPLVMTFTTQLAPFLEKWGFKPHEGLLLCLRRPLAHS